MDKGKTAVIIGAGPAGLTAAYMLLKETDIHPIVVEKSPHIGGISQTRRYGGNRIDIGGHRFFSKNDDVMALWQELMPLQGAPAADDALLGRDKPYAPGGPDPQHTDQVMLLRDRVSRIFYLGKFFDYPISLKARTFLNMGFARTMRAGFGYLKAVFVKRREDSLEDFYINRFGRPLYEMFFEDYTEKLWGVHPSRIAPDWGAQRVKGLSLWKAVCNVLAKPFRRKGGSVETSLIESFRYPKHGPGQLWETMAEEIRAMGGEVRMRTEALGIGTEGGRAQSVRTLDYMGGYDTLQADYVLSSMPVKDLVEGMGGAVPADVAAVAAALPYRDFITVGLLLDKLKIKNETTIKTLNGLVPDCWIYIQERQVKLGRLQIFNNWSPYMVDDLEHHVWVGLEYFCNEGDEMWTMADQDFIDFATGELASIGIIEPEAVRDAVRINIEKAYPAYFGSYAQFGKVRRYLDGFENLYCIGRNGQHRYNNMDHSMLTAMEAVKAIRTGGGKEGIWGVNADEEYHEEKGG